MSQIFDITLGRWRPLTTADLAGGGGGNGGTSVTNLTATVSPTSVVVVSDTGTDATIPLADSTNAGVMPPEAVAQLAGLGSAAEADVADFAPANHTHALLMTTDERTKLTALPAAADLSTSLAGKMANTMTGLQAVINAGTPAEKAALQSSVSGGGIVKSVDEPILLIGDSITAGAISGTSNPGNHINYKCAGRWFIAANRGIGGQTSAIIAARLAAEMQTYGCKTVVALSFTYNDIGSGLTLQQSIDAWTLMRDTVQAAGGRLYMGSPTPDGLSYGTPRAGVDSRWWALRAFCAENKITFIDLRKSINSGTGVIATAYNADGSVHPNEDGNVAIATPVAAVLNADFPGEGVLNTLDSADSYDLLGGAGLFLSSSAGVGTGWGYSGATGATASVAGVAQTITCVGMASGTAYLDRAISTGWAVGDVLEIRAHISSTGGAVYPRLRTVLSGAGSNYVLHEMRRNLPASPVVLRQKLDVGVTGVSLRLQAAGNGDGTISFSRISVRNMTALGLL